MSRKKLQHGGQLIWGHPTTIKTMCSQWLQFSYVCSEAWNVSVDCHHCAAVTYALLVFVWYCYLQKVKRKYPAMLLIKGCIWSMLIYTFSSVIVSFYCYIYYKHLNEIIYEIIISLMKSVFWTESFNRLKYKKSRKRLWKNHNAHVNISSLYEMCIQYDCSL